MARPLNLFQANGPSMTGAYALAVAPYVFSPMRRCRLISADLDRVRIPI